MPGIYADLEACRSVDRQVMAVGEHDLDDRLFDVDLVVSMKVSQYCSALMLEMFGIPSSQTKIWGKFDCKFWTMSLRTVILPGHSKQVFAPAMKRFHPWNLNAMKAIFMPILGKLGEVKIWRNFEDHWQLKIMKIHFMPISSYSSPVFWMDVSHLRFGRGQVLRSRGS